MNINLKWIFIFICFLCFLSLSNVCAIENNSTDLIQENLVDKPILTENNTNLNNSINTHLNSSDVVKYYHGSERYGVYLFDDDGNALANKNVSFILNSMTYKRITNDYGYASIGINLNSGNYSISCFFNGDDYYKPCNCSNWIFVNSTIFAEDLVKYFRNSSQYYSLFFSVNGTPLVNTTVTFNINGVFYTRTTNSSGWARLNINLNPGKYIITALNPVSDEYYTNNITVLPIIVDNHDLVKYYRNASQYCVRILGPTGNPVGAGEKVTFKINGVFYTRFTNSSGHTKLNLNLQPGNYIISVEYKGLTVANNITILSTLISEDLNKCYRDGTYFEVIVLDDIGNPYPNQTIAFDINGILYNRISDIYGVARLNINLMPGNYIICSSFGSLHASNRVHISDTGSSNRFFSLNSKNVNFTYNCGYSFFSAYLRDNMGNPVPSKSVLLSVGNYSCARLSDNSGCVRWFIDWDVGYYDVVVSFKYNNQVIASNYSILISKSSLILYNNSILPQYHNYTFSYSIKVCDYFNHYYPGLNISFNINNYTFFNITDEWGIAYCSFDLAAGTYQINTSFDGNNNFNPSYLVQNITVKDNVFVDKESGFYNQSNLTVNIISKNRSFYYSFDNISWNNGYDNISIVFINGEWDLFYCNNFSMIYNSYYTVDNFSPVIFASHESGVYNESVYVNLTAIDNVDENPLIYYSVNESNFLLYNDLLNISKTSSLKFYAIDFTGHKSKVMTCNYIFEKVGN